MDIEMKLSTQIFKAEKILNVEIADHQRCGIPFLNWHIKAAPVKKRKRDFGENSFLGAGLYGVCFEERLIYVGKFLGKCSCSGLSRSQMKEHAHHTGDIVNARWWQHFGSITARSSKLHVSQSVLRSLIEEFGEVDLLSGLCQAVPAIYRDAGCLGAKNRLKFAIQQWSEFSSPNLEPQALLAKFSYLYARIEKSNGELSPEKLKNIISRAEDIAIKKLNPECNKEYFQIGKNTVPTGAGEALRILADILGTTNN
jgi:hypothetical protein